MIKKINKTIKLDNIESKHSKKIYLTLFLLGMIIIFFRSSYTILFPQLYTEDGVWSGRIINEGFEHVFIYCRPDYFCWGNILMLKTAITINHIFYGYNLAYYPCILAILHYLFYSLVALLPVLCFKKSLNLPSRLILWLLTLLVPLGDYINSFEIWGKASNIGYLFFNIAFCLLFYRITNLSEKLETKNKIKIFLIDILLLLCVNTNIASFPLVVCAFIFSIIEQYTKLSDKKDFKKLFNYQNISFLVFNIILLIDIIVMRQILHQYKLVDPMAANHTALPSINNYIEYIGRAFLFFFTYPSYYTLNNFKVITMLILIFCMLLSSYLFCKNKRDKRFLLISFLSVLLLFLVTTIFRATLITVFNNYISSFPDRYFYGLNILFLFPIIKAIEIFLKQKQTVLKFISIIVVSVLLFNPIINFSYIFPFDKTPYPDTFKQNVIDAYKAENKINENIYRVMIYFDSWYIDLPNKYIEATINGHR